MNDDKYNRYLVKDEDGNIILEFFAKDRISIINQHKNVEVFCVVTVQKDIPLGG